ncbi:hypothetical protein KC946_00630 [Candidatus Saccharibacteria bacterium]|nr:hypothetical protein [Candidatus Saccharibacteria bacterium]
MGNDFQFTLLLVAIGGIFSILLAFIWVAIRVGPKGRGLHGHSGQKNGELFDDAYREKLQARGVARFEKTLDQNASFLQNDLRTVTEEVTQYIKDNIGEILRGQLDDQKQVVKAAEERMAQSFRNVDNALNDYQKTMSAEMRQELKKEVNRRVQFYEQNMSEIINHYVKETLAEELDVSDQIKGIISNLEENKTAILEDLKREV